MDNNTFIPIRITIGACEKGDGGDGRREQTLLEKGIYTFAANDKETVKKRQWTTLSKATHAIFYHSGKGGYFNTDMGEIKQKLFKVYIK